jgi:hypothetical protein
MVSRFRQNGFVRPVFRLDLPDFQGGSVLQRPQNTVLVQVARLMSSRIQRAATTNSSAPSTVVTAVARSE